MMRALIGSSLKLRFLVVFIAAALMFFGITQLGTMPVDVFPEFAPPKVEIQTICLGLSAEDEPSPKYITDAIRIIREKNVRAVFPEEQANPKTLTAIARETGVKIGVPLNADGTSRGAGSTFEGMIHHNVETIVAALKP